MDTLRAFLDHLYYSLVLVLAGLIGLYAALYVLDTAFEATLFPLGFKDFSVRSHIIGLLILWLVGSVGLAGFHTYQSIRNRPQDRIVYTKRHH